MLTTPSLADRLRVSVGRLARRLRQQSAEDDLTLSQASVLATLERHGPLAMSEVAAHERISKPSATGIVGRLVDKGLVERAPDPDDARSSIVTITPEGLRLLNRRRRQRTEYLARRIDALDAGDRAVLERAVPLLEKIVEAR
jgi:DNA-binding MarR family transcriptional regulator